MITATKAKVSPGKLLIDGKWSDGSGKSFDTFNPATGEVLTQVAEGGASLAEALLTAPAVFTFYFRQMIFPFWIGPSYPLRAVTLQNIGVSNFIIPLAVTTVAGWWMIRIARLSKAARIGLGLFLIPLVPAMNIFGCRFNGLGASLTLFEPFPRRGD